MITIDYFSDVLCVWAYGGQIRLDELRRGFGDEVLIRERFMPLFGDTATKIGAGWKDRGGFEGFGHHAAEVCEQWPHVTLHADVWTRCRPLSCSTAHLFLKAAYLSFGIEDQDAPSAARDQFHELIGRVRCAFFEQGKDVGRQTVLSELLRPTDPSVEVIREKLDSGAAAAALHRDAELATAYGVRGSPTYVFNEGRQMLYGNVGYRIVEANVNELLSGASAPGEPSWC